MDSLSGQHAVGDQSLRLAQYLILGRDPSSRDNLLLFKRIYNLRRLFRLGACLKSARAASRSIKAMSARQDRHSVTFMKDLNRMGSEICYCMFFMLDHLAILVYFLTHHPSTSTPWKSIRRLSYSFWAIALLTDLLSVSFKLRMLYVSEKRLLIDLINRHTPQEFLRLQQGFFISRQMAKLDITKIICNLLVAMAHLKLTTKVLSVNLSKSTISTAGVLSSLIKLFQLLLRHRRRH